MGNTIFPEGNAVKYLKEYFDITKKYINPYEEMPEDLKSISIEPDGTVLGESIYKKDIIEIFECYRGVLK